jgi:predicted TIM-barrel fold metal-dependent hydrolase
MIIDSHCHAWAYWPYQPPVPDPETRGRVEQLLHEMDRYGVDKAVLICAQITHNPANNDYVAEVAARHADRLYQFPDVDCSWSATYHTPGAAERLRAMAERWPIKGFTHYLRQEDDGWLVSAEGEAFFQIAAEYGLIASIAGGPQHERTLRQVAARFPTVPILRHHLAGVKASEEPPYPGLQEVLASARWPNIYIKLSGFAYCSQVGWEYPYHDTHRVIQSLYEAYGAQRMCWGSDYPVVRFSMTYQQALEAFRTHCTFVLEAEKSLILGETLAGLLAGAGPG